MREEPFEVKHPESLLTMEDLRSALTEANATLLSLSSNFRLMEMALEEMGGMLARIMHARATGDSNKTLQLVDQMITGTEFSVRQFEHVQGMRH